MSCKAQLSAPYLYVLYDKKIENSPSSEIRAFRKSKHCLDDLLTSLISSFGQEGGSTVNCGIVDFFISGADPPPFGLFPLFGTFFDLHASLTGV